MGAGRLMMKAQIAVRQVMTRSAGVEFGDGDRAVVPQVGLTV